MADPWQVIAEKITNPDPWAVASEKPAPSGSFGGEVWKQIKTAGKGLYETGKTIAQAYPIGPGGMPKPEGPTLAAQKRLLSGPLETVKAPIRELTNPAVPWQDRPGRAVLSLFTDPQRVQEFKERGQYGQALAAALTIPVLTVGLSEIFGRAMGKQLPATEARVNKLTSASGIPGAGGVNIPTAWEKALPAIDETVRATGGLPKPEALTPRWLLSKVKETLARKESEFTAALKPIETLSGKPVAVRDAILKKITPGMSKTAEGRAMEKALRKRAAEFDQPWTLRELDDERKRLFQLQRAPAAERLGVRTDADMAADRAAEDALRDTVYTAVEASSGKTGYFRDLKAQQAQLFNLNDQLTQRVAEISNKEAVRMGTPWYQREGVSLYGHPEKGSVGTSMHKLQSMFTGPERATRKATGKAFTPKSRVGRVARGAAAVGVGRMSRLTGPESEEEQD